MPASVGGPSFLFLRADQLGYLIGKTPMIRKLSASTFLTLMSVILIFQHPALGICECSRELYLSECGCSVAAKSLCSSCQAAEPKEHPGSSPCQNCIKKITCDPGEILWHPLAELDPWQGTEITSFDCPRVIDRSAGSGQGFEPSPTRPPPDHLPLFRRFEVIRL